MLTDNENLWLEQRKNLCNRCDNRVCCIDGKRYSYNTDLCYDWKSNLLIFECDMDEALFEARVAEYMAKVRPTKIFICDGGKLKTFSQMCPFCRLKQARLDVDRSNYGR